MATFLDRLASSMQEYGDGLEGPVAVAVSGGVDSVVLLRSLYLLQVPVVVLHVDHGLREDSAADATFVRELAADLGLPFERLHVTVRSGNRQREARAARYGALGAAARRHQCAVLVTGHTATDQAETVLMHLIRGSGLRGLAGMPPRRPLRAGVELVRPLLWATREDIVAEAERQGWAWREDPSNATEAYRRNRIRHQVLPSLQSEGGPGTIARIAASANAARAALPDLSAFALPGEQALRLNALRTVENRSAVWAEALAAWAPHVRRTLDLLRQLDGLVEGQVGRHVPVGEQVAWRDRDAIRFVDPAAPIERYVSVGESLRTDLGTFDLAELNVRALYRRTPPDPALASQDVVLLDRDALDGPLCLRTWRAGDRIAPRGMGGSKLVSDVLTERRVRPSERDRQLVLCVGDRVAWVVGHRLADWAERSESTQHLVRAEWMPRVSVG